MASTECDSSLIRIGEEQMHRIQQGLLLSAILVASVSAQGSAAEPDSPRWRWLTPQRFQDASPFSEGLAAVKINGKYGYLNQEGEVAIEPRFEQTTGFSDGLAGVTMDGEKWGYINEAGEMVIEPRFEGFGEWRAAGDFVDGLALVYAGKQYGYIGRDGEYRLKPQFQWASTFSQGRAIVCDANDAQYYIDTAGRAVIPKSRTMRFRCLGEFSENLAPVEDSNYLWGYMDTAGSVVVRPQYTEAGPFREGLAMVFNEEYDKYGFIDAKGTMMIQPAFSVPRELSPPECGYDWGNFHDGLAAVNVQGRWGYVDKTGDMAIAPQFAWASTFLHGLAVVAMSRADSANVGVINRKGEVVVPFIFKHMFGYSEGISVVVTREGEDVGPEDGAREVGFIRLVGEE